MIYGKPIEYPPPAFNPGDRVRFLYPEDFSQGGSHYVIASSHTHTLLEGFKYATPNWELRRTHKARPNTTEETPKPDSTGIRKRDRPKSFKIDSQILPASEIPLKDTRP